MKHYQGKKKWRMILETWPVLLILIALVSFFAYGVFGFVGKLKDTVENKQNARNIVVDLRERHAKLEGDLEFLETPQGTERVLREDFGLAKEGEGVVVVLDEEDEQETQEKKGFFKFMKGWFR